MEGQTYVCVVTLQRFYSVRLRVDGIRLNIFIILNFLNRFTGPFSAVASYLSEFHSTSTRAKVHLVRGMAGALALICLPLTAWAILPSTVKLVIKNDIGEWLILKTIYSKVIVIVLSFTDKKAECRNCWFEFSSLLQFFPIYVF